MAEHLLTEDSNTGRISPVNGQPLLRVTIGLDLAEMAKARQQPSQFEALLRRQFPEASTIRVNGGSVVVLDYVGGHPFGNMPIVRRHNDPNRRNVVVIGDLCAKRVTKLLRR